MEMTKKNLIRFWLNYSKNLIKLNIAKFLILIAGIGFYIGGNIIPKTTRFYQVERHFQDVGKHYYDLSYYRDALVYDAEQKLFQDGGEFFIKRDEWHDGAITLIVFAWIAFAVVFIFCVTNDSDINLELNQVLKDTIYDDYKITEIEEGGKTKYYHTSYSKIIRTGSHWDKYVSETTIKEFFNNENYYTKSELRDIKLNKIGI